MGAKFWSKEERDYFFYELLPLSQYANGYHNASNGGMTFAELVPVMQFDLDQRGQAKRQYTTPILFQHYYQRIVQRGVDKKGEGNRSNELSTAMKQRVRDLRTQIAIGAFGKFIDLITLLSHCPIAL